jgi:hypothetical protein
MADHLGSYLDELVPECPKGPLFTDLGNTNRLRKLPKFKSGPRVECGHDYPKNHSRKAVSNSTRIFPL